MDIDAIKTALETVGIIAEPEYTGGGIFVFYIPAGEGFIGMDEFSVCLYNNERVHIQELAYIDDSHLTAEARLPLLASLVKMTLDSINRGAN
jgi:hypothetical protein